MRQDNYIDKAKSLKTEDALHVEALGKYLSQHVPEMGTIQEVKQFPGGFSNLTFLLHTDKGEYVLRRPPFGKKIKSAHDMGREFRVLSALKPFFAQIPNPIVFCENEEVIGAPFYIMSRLKGIILRNRIPEGMDLSAPKLQALSRSTIETMVKLHNINLAEAGLDNFGKPEGYTQRQIDGWTRRYYKSKTDDILAMDSLATWLKDNMPTSEKSAFIHNDFKYDNVILSPENMRIIGVLDWEMATVGNPYMDFGTTLAYWAEPNDPDEVKFFSLTWLEGNMKRADIVAYYESLTGEKIPDLMFYYLYGIFKICTICQQIYARYKQGFANDPRFAFLIQVVKAMSSMGVQSIETGRISYDKK